MSRALPEPGYPWFPLEPGPACCEPRPLVVTRGLSVAYGSQRALDDVSLTIDRGCITALVGPSGCGKTSFLMALNRLTDLVPGCHVTGSIELGAQQVLDPKLDVVALRRRVGMIFQRPNPFPFSIARNLTLPLLERGVRERALVAERIEQALCDVGLWDEVAGRLDAPAQSLSGGQQQRLCLARALVLEPEVLLLDEPCSALDPIASGVVEDLIARLRGRYTIVVVTHNLAQARRIADAVAVFWVRAGAGTVIESGPTARIFENPRSEIVRAYVSGLRG